MRGERLSIFVVFALNGAALGSWAPRVPALAEQVQARPGQLGLALLGASVGMLIAASVSGRLIERAGARMVIAGSTVLAAAVLPLVGYAPSLWWLGIALTLLGVSVGGLDVAMNVAAVVAERRAGRPMMPVFHAGFSFGALAGSVLASVAAAHDWSPGRHLSGSAVVAVLVLLAIVRLIPDSRPSATTRAHRDGMRVAPVRRPLLWFLAAVALCSAIAEGASSDWSALLLVTQQHVSQAAGALAYSAFALAMAIARLAGAWLQRRFGATRTLAVGSLSAGVGLLVAATVPAAGLAYAGFVLAGAGLAASFPVALSLAGHAGRDGGEREIAFVTAVAYSGFLAGPPLIGGIAQLTSLSISFVVVALIAAMIAPAALGVLRAGAVERRRAERVPVSP